MHLEEGKAYNIDKAIPLLFSEAPRYERQKRRNPHQPQHPQKRLKSLSPQGPPILKSVVDHIDLARVSRLDTLAEQYSQVTGVQISLNVEKTPIEYVAQARTSWVVGIGRSKKPLPAKLVAFVNLFSKIDNLFLLMWLQFNQAEFERIMAFV